MAVDFDPKKIKFEDYLHVEGVKKIDAKLPAFKTDGVRTKNLKLIKDYLVRILDAHILKQQIPSLLCKRTVMCSCFITKSKIEEC